MRIQSLIRSIDNSTFIGSVDAFLHDNRIMGLATLTDDFLYDLIHEINNTILKPILNDNIAAILYILFTSSMYKYNIDDRRLVKVNLTHEQIVEISSKWYLRNPLAPYQYSPYGAIDPDWPDHPTWGFMFHTPRLGIYEHFHECTEENIDKFAPALNSFIYKAISNNITKSHLFVHGVNYRDNYGLAREYAENISSLFSRNRWEKINHG